MRKTDESVKFFLTNRRITVCGVYDTLRISFVLVQNILKDNLNMHEIATSFVPCTCFVCAWISEGKQSDSFHTPFYLLSDLALIDFCIFSKLKMVLKEGCWMISPWLEQDHRMHLPSFEHCISWNTSYTAMITGLTVFNPKETTLMQDKVD